MRTRIALRWAAGLGAALGVGLGTGLAPGAALANAGFALNDGLADWTGNAYAGEAAKAYDAGTAWTNPAGMVRLDNNETDGSITLIDPSLAFHGQDYVDGVAVPGRQSRSGIDSAVSGGQATVISLSPRWRLGFAVQSPFASRLAFTPDNYTGRYQVTRNAPTNIQALFSVAYAVDSHLSIGGGPIVGYLRDRQARALNLQDASTPLGILPLGPQGVDPVAEFRGDGWSAGFDLGVLYQFTPSFRVGVNYHSATYYKLEGHQDVSVPDAVVTMNPLDAIIPGIGGSVASAFRQQDYDASVRVTLPGWLDTSAYWQISPQWALMANVTWTNWSLFQHNAIVPDDGSIPTTTDIQYNFRDTVTAGVGVNYRPARQPRLLLQGGLTWDESPVDSANRQASIPDGDRIELGAGVSWRATRNITLTLAYTHYFFPNRNSVDNTLGNVSASSPLGTVALDAGTLRGDYDLGNNALAIGFKQLF